MHNEDFTSTTLQTGSTASISTTAVQLVAAAAVTTKPRQGVKVKATAANTVTVYIGISTVTAGVAAPTTDGYPLAAGESEWFPVDNPALLYARTASGTVSVSWMIC